jgi:hypothetical protein
MSITQRSKVLGRTATEHDRNHDYIVRDISDLISSLASINPENIANADLTFDGNREHNTDGFSLGIFTDNGLAQEAWFYMDTISAYLGYNQASIALSSSGGADTLNLTADEIGLFTNQFNLTNGGVNTLLGGALSTDYWAIQDSTGTDNLLKVDPVNGITAKGSIYLSNANFPTITFDSLVGAGISGQITSYSGNLDIKPTTRLTLWGAGLPKMSTDASGITISDAVDFVFNTTTGTKFGTATNQKFGFWNATPVIQPTTGISAGTFVSNTGTNVHQASTFDGYTIGQVVAALRQIGLLA